MYIDTHCHYDLPSFNTNRFQLLAEIKKAGIDKLIIPAILAESNINMRLKLDYIRHPELLEKSGYERGQLPKLYFAAGVHPTRTGGTTSADNLHKEKFILNAIRQPDTVAIGETGLDFHGNYLTKALLENQLSLFSYQLDLARQYALPVILHIREAYDDAMAILRSADLKRGGVVHCFQEG